MLQELAQEIENTARAIVEEIHTALPGKIISFNAEKNLAVVKPIGEFITSNGIKLEYPTISDVPVIFPFCQQLQVGMVFPIKSNDTCLIVVSEVELDEWRSGAKSESSLKFDLTSAVIIPGLLLGENKYIIEAIEKNAVVINAKGGEITISDKGITVDTGKTILDITTEGVSLIGNLKVKGNITVTEDVTAGNISLKKHTHISSEPGSSTGKAQ